MSSAAAISATTVAKKAFSHTPSVHATLKSTPQTLLSPQFKSSFKDGKTLKFHFHESVVFDLQSQVKLVNRVLLENDTKQLFTPLQEVALQRSFNNYHSKFSDEDLITKGFNCNNVEFNRKLKQIYYPFMNKNQLDTYFGDKVRNLPLIKKDVFEHVRLLNEPFNVLKKITSSASLDFGLLRSSYFPSLGIVNYPQLLRYTNKKIFQRLMTEINGYSEILSDIDNYKNEVLLKQYISVQPQNTSNYFVINSPEKSEFFINLSNKLGLRDLKIVLVTDKYFQCSSSNIENLLYKFDQCLRGDKHKEIQNIQDEILIKNLIVVKSMKEFKKMLRVLDTNIEISKSVHRLTELELSILGGVETKNPVRYGI